MPSSIARLNQAAQVVREEFAKCFVRLSGESLTAKLPAELRLDHGERSLDVRAFVVTLVEVRPVQVVVVMHLVPGFAFALRRSVLPKVDVGLDPFVVGQSLIRLGRVGFVGGNFGNLELFGCFVDQRRKIVGVAPCASLISTEVTMLVLTPHIKRILIQSWPSICLPYFALYQHV